MSDTDQSLYNLRYNQVTSGMEAFGGGTPQWTPLVLSSPATPPAGDDTQVQFNNAGAFGASPELTWSNSNNQLTIMGASPTLGASFSIASADNSANFNIYADNTGLAGQVATIKGIPFKISDIASSSILPSALVEIQSTTHGFLLPRMTTTQKNAIATPDEGLVVYDTTLHKLAVWTGAAWETVTSV